MWKGKGKTLLSEELKLSEKVYQKEEPHLNQSKLISEIETNMSDSNRLKESAIEKIEDAQKPSNKDEAPKLYKLAENLIERALLLLEKTEESFEILPDENPQKTDYQEMVADMIKSLFQMLKDIDALKENVK